MPIFRFPFFYNPNYYNRLPTPNMYTFTDNASLQRNQHNTNYVSSNTNTQTLNRNNIQKDSNPPVSSKKLSNNYSSRLNNDLNNLSKINKKNNSKNNSSNNENYFFELFGLKLYFDDILLLCLIFFLYEEGVKDDELFLSLVLLLLS